jgi:hypothetical protein
MRAASTCVRWASCALALLILSISADSADADHRKSLADCTAFDQNDRGDTNVAMTIRNSCSIPVDCELTWRVVCDPDSKKRRSVHPGDAKLTISEGTSQTTEASAAVCGDGGWQIDSVGWSCQENKD